MSKNPRPSLMSAEDSLRQRKREMTDPGMPRPDMHAEDALVSRRSIRAFQNKPVPRDLMRRILEAARWAPSGSNIQPWKVHVLNGNARRKYTDAMIAAEKSGEPRDMQYHYYPREFREEFLFRRRACGFGLYGALEIAREDRESRRDAFVSNYRFFGAATGLIFWIPSELEHGSWLDYGTFIQSISVAARGWGLSTIAQGALGEFPHVAHEMFEVGDDFTLIGGMSIGWPAKGSSVNLFQPDRIDVDDFTTWLD